jgi:hypothetical protein
VAAARESSRLAPGYPEARSPPSTSDYDSALVTAAASPDHLAPAAGHGGERTGRPASTFSIGRCRRAPGAPRPAAASLPERELAAAEARPPAPAAELKGRHLDLAWLMQRGRAQPGGGQLGRSACARAPARTPRPRAFQHALTDPHNPAALDRPPAAREAHRDRRRTIIDLPSFLDIEPA